jgi:hypothetical protein
VRGDEAVRAREIQVLHRLPAAGDHGANPVGGTGLTPGAGLVVVGTPHGQLHGGEVAREGPALSGAHAGFAHGPLADCHRVRQHAAVSCALPPHVQDAGQVVQVRRQVRVVLRGRGHRAPRRGDGLRKSRLIVVGLGRLLESVAQRIQVDGAIRVVFGQQVNGGLGGCDRFGESVGVADDPPQRPQGQAAPVVEHGPPRCQLDRLAARRDRLRQRSVVHGLLGKVAQRVARVVQQAGPVGRVAVVGGHGRLAHLGRLAQQGKLAAGPPCPAQRDRQRVEARDPQAPGVRSEFDGLPECRHGRFQRCWVLGLLN